MMTQFSIGQLSLATECKVETIRYYEKIGLLSAPERTNGNQRRYDTSAYQKLLFILHARDLGFSIAAVRQLLALAGQPDSLCEAADIIAQRQLAAVRSKIQRLKGLEKILVRITQTCENNGHIHHCRVIEALAACTSCYERHHHAE